MLQYKINIHSEQIVLNNNILLIEYLLSEIRSLNLVYLANIFQVTGLALTALISEMVC